MSTQQLQLVCDNSTLANFKQWAKPISDWFRTIGYTNTADTGQVNWSTIASVPTSGTYVYDIFQTNDSFTQFFVRVDYGSVSGTAPDVIITIGTATNGSGTITGSITTAQHTSPQTFTVPSTVTQYECDFTGDSANSRIGAMYWRNATANRGQQLFAIERSLNASGAYTNTYVTLWTCGSNAGITGSQQTLYFGIGPSTLFPGDSQTGAGSNNAGWCSLRIPTNITTANTVAFNGTIPFDTCAPHVGFWDYPCTMVGAGWGTDYAEGVTFTVTLYGSTRTYMPGKIGAFANPIRPAGNNNLCAVMLRYD